MDIAELQETPNPHFLHGHGLLPPPASSHEIFRAHIVPTNCQQSRDLLLSP